MAAKLYFLFFPLERRGGVWLGKKWIRSEQIGGARRHGRLLNTCYITTEFCGGVDGFITGMYSLLTVSHRSSLDSWLKRKHKGQLSSHRFPHLSVVFFEVLLSALSPSSLRLPLPAFGCPEVLRDVTLHYGALPHPPSGTITDCQDVYWPGSTRLDPGAGSPYNAHIQRCMGRGDGGGRCWLACLWSEREREREREPGRECRRQQR